MATPKFSRITYEMVAATINKQFVEDDSGDDYSNSDEKIETLENLAVKFCQTFGLDNPQFDHYRFLTACGLDAEKLLS